MKSMKLTKSESTEMMSVEANQDAPAYPWGLRLELNDESMKKLGLQKLPKVGDKMKLEAIVSVDRVSQVDTKEGGKREDMSLQITDMELSSDVDDEKEPTENKLYTTDGRPAAEASPSGKTILVDL